MVLTRTLWESGLTHFIQGSVLWRRFFAGCARKKKIQLRKSEGVVVGLIKD